MNGNQPNQQRTNQQRTNNQPTPILSLSHPKQCSAPKLKLVRGCHFGSSSKWKFSHFFQGAEKVVVTTTSTW